jgi:hypothetical protein
MREFKGLLIAALVLTFLGGMGAGAWVRSLAAAPEVVRPGSVDRRLDDFQQAFPDLSASQMRQLRTVLLRHDDAVRKIRERLSAEQFREKLASEAASREEIRGILTETQRVEYDKRTRRK